MDPILQLHPSQKLRTAPRRSAGSTGHLPPRARLPSLKNELRLRLQEHLALLENAQETAQDGRALRLL